jgi:predicted nuclease of predicted toxin-antitoxin system
MKILLDMNLSPSWVLVLAAGWARQNGFVVFTHDLDFSALLVATQAGGQ